MTGSRVRLRRTRQNPALARSIGRRLRPVKRGSPLREDENHVKGLHLREPLVAAAAAASTRHGCIYRAPPRMSHLAPCPLFLRQIYGSPLHGGLLDLRPTPPTPPPPSFPTPPRPILTPSTPPTAFREPQKKHLAPHSAAPGQLLACASLCRFSISGGRGESCCR